MKNTLTPSIRLTFYFLLVLLSLTVGGQIADHTLSRLCIAVAMLIPVGIERAVTRAPILGKHPLRGGGAAAAFFPLFLLLLSVISEATSLLMTAQVPMMQEFSAICLPKKSESPQFSRAMTRADISMR